MGPDDQALKENLDLFAGARCWKAYVRSRIRAELRGRVLEVGSGIGANAELLLNERVTHWLCLEPEPSLAEKIPERLHQHPLGARVEVKVGTTEGLPTDPPFDVAVYLDVLEHIEDDRGELEQVATRLAPGGRVVLVSPAHPSLYTEYDRRIGHHRRYTKDMIRRISPPTLSLDRIEYLDAVGALASLGNRVLLRQGEVGARQFFVWDRLMVPLSRLIDPVLGYRLGKSILAVWRRRV